MFSNRVLKILYAFSLFIVLVFLLCLLGIWGLVIEVLLIIASFLSEKVRTVFGKQTRAPIDAEKLEKDIDVAKHLTDAEELFSELSKSKDISSELKSVQINEKMLKIMNAIKQNEQLPQMHELGWAIRASMETVKPELLLEVGGIGDDKIRENLAAANQLHFYRKFVTSYAFQKMGFENHHQMAARISEWQPNTLVRDNYAIGMLEPYSKPERCFVLTVTLAAWLRPGPRLRKAILGSEETRILLMSPFIEDNAWLLFQEEYEAPVKPTTRFLYPYWKDLFRRLYTIADNLDALADLARTNNVQVKLYTNYKPPLRFTLFPGKVATIFPTPYRFTGDLYTFCGKVTDKELLQKLEDKYEEIWRSHTRDVNLAACRR